MSAIAGLWHREGRPVRGADVDRMLDGLAHRGPHGRSRWQDLSIALGHASLQVTPESRGERQPLVDDSTRTVLTFDGRLDNREELIRALDAAGGSARSPADAEIVLRACQAWGAAAPRRLLGDFAFAFWDGVRRRFLGVRDARGTRPFCYRIDGARLAWASEMHVLAQPPFDQPPPNEGFIGELLCHIPNSTRDTLFSGVQRLPPASMLIATPDELKVETYWQLDPRRDIRYRDDRDYDDHFLTLFDDAVRCRLRTDGAPTGVMLSGGIDSSLVAGMAARVATRSGHPSPKAFSLIYPGDPCNEQLFIEAAAAHAGLESVCVAHPDVTPYEDDIRRYRDLPNSPGGAGSDALFALAREHGVRVMLTGAGGDEWFSGHQSRYADLLRRGRLATLYREVRNDIRADALNGWCRAVWNTVRPMTPDAVLDLARRAVGHAPIPSWIRPEFAARIRLRDRLYDVPRRFGFPTHAQDEQFREAVAGFNIHAGEMFDRAVAKFGLEAAHPLDDRRLMEFGMALPEEQRWRDGARKAILRRAGASLVTPTVRTRGENADYVRPYDDAWKRLNGRARLAAPGAAFDSWVDRDALLAGFDRVVGVPGKYDWPYWMALAVRLWADEVLDDCPRAPLVGHAAGQ